MIKFKELTKDDKNFILSTYKTSESRESAQKKLVDFFSVTDRTIRNWYRKLTKVEPVERKKDNILVVGDLHEPFTLDGYLDFCIEQYSKYNCTKVIFIGDVVDNHYASYHETDPDGMGGGEELSLAIKKISRWYKAFPKAHVIIGNHCRIIARKAFSSSIPKLWIKEYKDVLQTPGWDFVDRLVINNIQFIHGESSAADKKCVADMQSTVQGHLHTQMFTKYFVGSNFKVFGTQTGCGIDHDSYAMAYAKRGKKPAIGCVVIINEELPINISMDL